ncbi:MAG: hypothetical protein WEB60_02190 [Terrimicrobiaceae bacterium]
MKCGLPLVLCSLCLSVVPMHGQEATPLATRLPELPLPSARQSVILEPGERNPFGIRQITTTTDFGIVQGETEESRLRTTITRLSVSGASVSPDGKPSVILGPMAVSEGAELPQLLPSQFERIVVNKIADNEVIFGFLERDGTSDRRAFSVQYDLAPKVRFALPTDVMDSAGGTRPFPLSGVVGAEGNEGL